MICRNENGKIIVEMSKEEAIAICKEYEDIKPAPKVFIGQHNAQNYKSNSPRLKDFVKWIRTEI